MKMTSQKRDFQVACSSNCTSSSDVQRLMAYFFEPINRTQLFLLLFFNDVVYWCNGHELYIDHLKRT